jgi:hypothetical protein
MGVKILKSFDADPDQGSGIWNLFDRGSRIPDGKNSNPRSRINIPDHCCSLAINLKNRQKHPLAVGVS